MTDLVTTTSDERLAELIASSKQAVDAGVGHWPYKDNVSQREVRSILIELQSLRAQGGAAPIEALPAPVSEEMVEASCPGCHGTGDQGGNPSYGVCDDCNGTGKVNQPLPAALAAKGGQ